VADDKPEVLPAQLEARLKRVLDQVLVPFGLFTTHQYSIDSTSLNGFDALLSAYWSGFLNSNLVMDMVPIHNTINAMTCWEPILKR